MSEQNRMSDTPEDPESVEQSVDDESPSDDAVTDERDEGSVRRPLIRATLKHPEGTPPAPRQPPVFTSHQQTHSGRGQNWNSRSGSDNGHPNRKKKSHRDRQGQQASSRGGGGQKYSSRPDRRGQQDAPSGNRSSSRRSKGRSR